MRSYTVWVAESEDSSNVNANANVLKIKNIYKKIFLRIPKKKKFYEKNFNIDAPIEKSKTLPGGTEIIVIYVLEFLVQGFWGQFKRGYAYPSTPFWTGTNP